MQRTKAHLKNLLRVIVVVGLLIFLVQRGHLSGERILGALKSPHLIIPAWILLVLTTIVGAFRWRWLLQSTPDTRGRTPSVSKAIELTYVGQFFGVVLPGSVTGDVLKAYYAGKEQSGQPKGPIFASILYDRINGLAGLIWMSCGALAFASLTGVSHPVPDSLFWSALVLGFVVFLGYFYLGTLSKTWDPVSKITARIPKLGSLYQGLLSFGRNFRGTAAAVTLSILIQFMISVACYLFALALQPDLSISFLEMLVLSPLGLLVTVIPVLPGGIGTGHVAFSWLLAGAQFPFGADLFTLFLIGSLIQGSVGAVVYLRMRSKVTLASILQSQP